MSFRVYQECRAASGWQLIEVPSSMPDLNDPYKVLVPPWDHDERDYRGKLVEVICECESYLRRGYCRHQEEAQGIACDWTEGRADVAQTEEQARDHICPNCGGSTRTIIEDV